MSFLITKKEGSVLILALWTLSILTVFAVQIGLTTRQRISLLSRLEDKSQLRNITEAGIKKAIAALRFELQRSGINYTAHRKYYLHNNAEIFRDIELGNGRCNVVYSHWNEKSGYFGKRYGIVDEEQKININTAKRDVLARLFEDVLSLGQDDAKGLAEAIFDWREIGRAQVTGFYSDDYYENLAFPYKTKDAVFESLDELLLVKGVNSLIFNEIAPFVTVYGDGRVNVNTAPRPVLMALGLSESAADKLLVVRRGFDEQEATVDDYIFSKTYDIASEMTNYTEMEIDEIKQIDRVNKDGLIKTNSFVYSVETEGYLSKEGVQFRAKAVYDLVLNRIEYWREK